MSKSLVIDPVSTGSIITATMVNVVGFATPETLPSNIFPAASGALAISKSMIAASEKSPTCEIVSVVSLSDHVSEIPDGVSERVYPTLPVAIDSLNTATISVLADTSVDPFVGLTESNTGPA